MDFPNFNDLFRIGRDEVLTKSKLLSLESVEREGTDANVMLAAGAATGDEIVALLADVVAGLFLDSAVGQKLDKLVWDRYGLVRKPAAPAIGSVDFTCASANPAAFVIPIGTILSTSTGLQYVTISSAFFPQGSVGPIVVAVRSTLAGLDQQASIGTIRSVVTPIPGQPADLAVNNSLATTGADNVESDGSLRDRARRFFLTARKGTLAAIEAGALAVPGVRTAKALDVIDVLGRPARVVQLVVSDAFTDGLVQQNVNPATYQVQSQALGQIVFDALSDVRAGGIFVHTTVAQVVMQPITLRLRFRAGANADLTALIARATVVATVNALAPGATMRVNDLYKALRTVGGLEFVGDEIVSPAGDVVPRSLQVIRTSMSLVVAQALQTANSNAVLNSTLNPDAFVVAA